MKQQAVEVFSPQAESFYSLDHAARLAGISRRTVLVYCREGLVSPATRTRFGALIFNDYSIRQLRYVEYLKEIEGINLVGVKMIIELQKKVERLRDDFRFFHGL
jgi:MerR family transcriptional regulator, heat shock protein HspR